MEYSNYHEESTNSSEVDDEEKKVDLGVGRSYECVFCKRGFNTAQALGGHMNIHRKDRSSSAAARNNKPKQTRFSSSNLLGQLRCFSPPHQPHLTYSTYFPPASSTTTNDSDRHPSDPNWRMTLINVDNNRHLQDKELDLELRLGYH